MPTYDEDLLGAALRLLSRAKGQKGKLPAARIRRSISTLYYALFHFILDEVGKSIIGSHNDLVSRRRIFVRSLTHAGIKAALDKVRSTSVDQSVEALLRPRGAPAGKVSTPIFARELAATFSDAQAKRHDADYDLNKPLSLIDARTLRRRVIRIIADWRAARSVADKDFKDALCVLIVLQGRVRREN